MSLITGNKGEWSEIYTLFKILSDKCLYPGDEDLNRIESLIYPIVQVLRTESSGSYEYSINQDLVVVTSNQHELIRIPIVEFQTKAVQLLEKIQSERGTFSSPEIEAFMKKIYCVSLKAQSTSKTDITIVIHDERTNQKPTLGFSIKSQIGSPSTLLNAGKSTNFQYKIVGKFLSEEEVGNINDISGRSKIKERVKAVQESSCMFDFVKVNHEVFSDNLVLIDTALPQILASMVLKFYSTNLSRTADLLSSVESDNILGFNTANGHPFYAYKIKRLCTDAALGMTPAKVWGGDYDATGGYLIVKSDGDIVCYHIYEKSQFEDYLINNTKFETASSSRYDFGKIYSEAGSLFMNLNLQIRFVK